MTDVSRLPAPVAAHWEWQLLGLCRGADASTFFLPEGERGPRKARRERAAKEICRQCPVIDHCREFAIATREPYGVWGGMTPEEREELIRHRSRPMTEAVAG
ncbi:MAG TPA: WhiB family transcriptional regulator [Mycobacteriales bacterium]|jgi:WhiB family redox-sensing transcriptional regulator|nr:WhiB family transcriptional regulator [Mycobacteriales bacterium]